MGLGPGLARRLPIAYSLNRNTERGLDYELRFVDLAKSENMQPTHLALIAEGLTPVIINHDGPDGQTVTMAQSPSTLINKTSRPRAFPPQLECRGNDFSLL